MINNVEEFTNYAGDMIRLSYDRNYDVYYLQNLTRNYSRGDMGIELIKSSYNAQAYLRKEKKVLINAYKDVEVVARLGIPEGLSEDGRVFNLFVATDLYKLFMDGDYDGHAECPYTCVLDKLFESNRERHRFYSLLCKYLETGAVVLEPIKIKDGQSRLLTITLLMRALFGSHHSITLNKETGISMAHITAVGSSMKGSLMIQDILNRNLEKTAPFQIIIGGGSQPLPGLHNFTLRTQYDTDNLATIPPEDIIEGVKYLKQYKGDKEFTGEEYDTTARVHSKYDFAGMLKAENWTQIDILFQKYKIEEYTAGWNQGYICRVPFNNLMRKEMDTTAMVKVNKDIGQYILERFGRTNIRITSYSVYDRNSNMTVAYGPFKSLIEYYSEKYCERTDEVVPATKSSVFERMDD